MSLTMSAFLNAIPAAAASPYALVAYGIAAGIFVVNSWTVTRQKQLLKRLNLVDKPDVIAAMRLSMGATLREGMTADEYIRARKHSYFVLCLIVVLLLAAVIILTAMIGPPSTAQQGHAIGPWMGPQPKDNLVQLYPGVEIESALHKVNFEAWTPASGPSKDQCCEVTWDIDMKLRRVRKDALYFAKRAATTGGAPAFTSSTHASPSYRPVVLSVDRGPVMNKYDVLFDISNNAVDEEFPLHMRSVRHGSFSDPKHEDLYLDIFQPSREETVELHFRADKPGKNFRYAEYPNVDKKSEHPIVPAAADIDTSTPNVLRWTVRHPLLGYSYKVEWDW